MTVYVQTRLTYNPSCLSFYLKSFQKIKYFKSIIFRILRHRSCETNFRILRLLYFLIWIGCEKVLAQPAEQSPSIDPHHHIPGLNSEL